LAAGTADYLTYLPLVTTNDANMTPACPSPTPTPTPTPTPMPTPDMTARVTWVVDGDTVRLDNGEYLRYIGIDTPELGDEETGEPPECYAEEALWADLRLVKNKSLNIYFDTEQRDRYNRLLAYAYLPDGTFVNAWLAREGYAKTLIISPNTQLARAILDAEDEARAAGRGLWGACTNE